jgi:hypothetical protein
MVVLRRCGVAQSYGGNVKGEKIPCVCSELVADISFKVTASRAAFALYLNLCTSVCRKRFKVVITKGIKTPSQIVIIKVKLFCDEENM